MKKIILPLFLVVFFIVGVIGAFVLGLHWTTTRLYSLKAVPKNLTCVGHNNETETYQVDCYAPLTKGQQNFTFRNHLSCRNLTNHQLDTAGSEFGNTGAKVYSSITLIPADYMSFTLDFDLPNKKIMKSVDPGEGTKDPFIVAQQDPHIVSGMRITRHGDIFGAEYQYLTVSKKTGKGVLMWNNSQDYSANEDSFASFFFQCE